ncbi:unnamed protein product [Rotaria sordida]|uniref:Uncharacterized protein n=1 Tax=Rotaria sordida TaxID=392033 RepID=A0A819TD69_9BILA|nr:unnamed protein product [Rotaria sordida]CAF1489697.1 unnamed protein product [Rotaria sordida]CAF1506318.1 unnamed protein product [Rotaria sordida]CAF4063957.1 unnamed protein product [Rotaria sordida]CAF4097040.1 unnamed protein product [Rotaria sordida]
MQLTRILIIVFLLGLFLTIVLSDLTHLDMENNDLDLNSEKHLIFKRDGYDHEYHDNPRRSRQCVPCKFGIIRCCYPNVCVKKRLRPDKCLRIKT